MPLDLGALEEGGAEGTRLSLAPGPLTSLPESMGFILFGKTILVVHKKFGLFLGHPLGKRVYFARKRESEKQTRSKAWKVEAEPTESQRNGFRV